MTITYALATDADALDAALTRLTEKGNIVMYAIGSGQVSFFDNGIVEGSGSYGDCLAGEIGARPGTLTGLVKQGLLTVGNHNDPGGAWYALTALGADVANLLAGQLEPAQLEVVVEHPTCLCELRSNLTCAAHKMEADVVEDFSYEAQVEADAKADYEEMLADAPKQVTKAVAYEAIKFARQGLRAADEAVYRGTQAQLEAALVQAVFEASRLLEAVRSGGVNCGAAPTSVR